MKKIIAIIQLSAVASGVIAFGVFCYLCFIRQDASLLLTIVFCLLLIVGTFLDFLAGYLTEKTNPLNRKIIRQAGYYILKKRRGRKSDFVLQYSDTLYQHFIRNGIINELIAESRLSAKSDPIWQITRFGQSWIQNFSD